jgi:hypothetical protein
VETQLWIAIAVHVLAAIVKKRLGSQASLHTILQILSLALFEKLVTNQLAANIDPEPDQNTISNQLDLFT